MRCPSWSTVALQVCARRVVSVGSHLVARIGDGQHLPREVVSELRQVVERVFDAGAIVRRVVSVGRSLVELVGLRQHSNQ